MIGYDPIIKKTTLLSNINLSKFFTEYDNNIYIRGQGKPRNNTIYMYRI